MSRSPCHHVHIMSCQRTLTDYVLETCRCKYPLPRYRGRPRIVEEVRTGIPYYEKKLPKDAYGDLSGACLRSHMDEDGLFKYRRLAEGFL